MEIKILRTCASDTLSLGGRGQGEGDPRLKDSCVILGPENPELRDLCAPSVISV